MSNNFYTNDYMYKIESAFVACQFQVRNLLDFIKMEPDNIDRYYNILNNNIIDYTYDFFELELRLRALRDKLNESEIL